MPELVSSNDATSSGTSAEVQRLRAELRQKDELLRVATRAMVPSEATAQPDMAAPQEPSLDPAAKVADLLDERLLMAAKDPRQAAEAERALRQLANPSVLGQSKVTSVYCGSSLCRVILKAEKDTLVNESVVAMSAQLPKLFGATLAFPLGAGQSALYVGKSSEDLDVEPPRPEANKGPTSPPATR